MNWTHEIRGGTHSASHTKNNSNATGHDCNATAIAVDGSSSTSNKDTVYVQKQKEINEVVAGVPGVAFRSVGGMKEYETKGEVTTDNQGVGTVTRYPHKGTDQKVEIPDVVRQWFEHSNDSEHIRDGSGNLYHKSRDLGSRLKSKLETILRHILNKDDFDLDEATEFEPSKRSHGEKILAWKGRDRNGKEEEGLYHAGSKNSAF